MAEPHARVEVSLGPRTGYTNTSHLGRSHFGDLETRTFTAAEMDYLRQIEEDIRGLGAEAKK